MNWTNRALILNVLLFVAIAAVISSYLSRSFPLLLGSLALVSLYLGIRWRRIENASLAVCTSLAFLALFELIYPKLGSNSGLTHHGGDYVSKYFVQTDIGAQAKPGIHSSKLVSRDGQVIYDVKYSIGPDGFRQTPVTGNVGTTRINFFGCSYMFGEGLNDNETIPYYVSESMRGVTVKNFGFHAYGPHQALAIMQSRRDTSGLINVFLTMPWQAERSSCIPWYTLNSPKFQLDKNGRVTRKGVCCQNGARRSMLNHSVIYNLVHRLYINYSIPQDAQIDLYLAIICELNRISKLREQEFIVGFIKAEPNFFVGNWSNEKIMAWFAERGIKLIDLTLAKSSEWTAREYYLHPLDKHPSALANRKRTRLLIDFMNRSVNQN